MSPKIKAMHDSVLRGGLCILWILALLISIEYFLVVMLADNADEQNFNGIRMVGSFGVFLIAAGMHGYLVHIGKKKNADGAGN
jgi:K+ transporter